MVNPALTGGHYRMDIISSVGHPRSDLVMPLVLCDKCQNIHILALNLHLLISWFLLFCFILFPFYVFCVFVGHGRKGSVSGKFPSLKGKLGRTRRCGKD
jgi:hypothetical protein